MNFYTRYKNDKYDTNNKYYADVNYNDKDLAKSIGAMWDWTLKSWYFNNPHDRDTWDKQHSKYYKQAKYNKTHKYFAIINICRGTFIYSKPLVSIGVVFVDYLDLSILKIGQYYLKEHDINETSLDIRNEMDSYHITDILIYSKESFNVLPDLYSYNWYDIYQTKKFSSASLLTAVHNSNRHRYISENNNDALDKCYMCIDLLKQLKEPITSFYDTIKIKTNKKLTSKKVVIKTIRQNGMDYLDFS